MIIDLDIKQVTENRYIHTYIHVLKKGSHRHIRADACIKLPRVEASHL